MHNNIGLLTERIVGKEKKTKQKNQTMSGIKCQE